MSPPQVPTHAPITEFSAARAIEHLKVIAAEPHPVGSPHHARVRDYLLAQLRSLGLSPEIQSAQSATQAVGWIQTSRVQNIVAKIPGTAPSQPLLLSAHYDSVANSHGASDDGSGVVMLLETARALLAGSRIKNDLILLFTDNEESLLQGSVAFVRAKSPVGAVLNFEARGDHGPVVMFETSAENGALIPFVARAAPRPVAQSLFGTLAKILPNDTDFTIFRHAGIAGLNFAYASGMHHYHTRFDDLAHLDPRSIQHQGSYALSLARALGQVELPLPARSDHVYFDFLSLGLIHYPGWVAAVLGIALLLAIAWRWPRESESQRWYSPLLGVGAFALAAFFGVSGVGLTSIWVSAQLDWLRVVHHAHFAVGYLFILAGVMAVGLSFSVRRGENFFWGVVWGSGIMGAMLGIVAPTASYPFHFLTAALLLRRQRWIGQVIFFAAAVIFLELLYALFVMDSGAMPVIPILFSALASALWFPAAVSSPRLRMVGAAAAVTGMIWIGMRTVGPWRFEFNSENPYANYLVHAHDEDANKAFWVSWSRDPWTDRFLGNTPQGGSLPQFFPYRDHHLFTASDRGASGGGPGLKLESDSRTENSRTLNLRLFAPAGARAVQIWEESGAKPRETRVATEAVYAITRFSPETDEKLWKWINPVEEISRWKLRAFSVAPGGLAVTVTFSGNSPLKFRVVAIRDGLPLTDKDPRRRADQIPFENSDQTLVSRGFEFQ